MWQVDDSLVRAWASGYTVTSRCSAWRGSQMIDADLDVVGGGVSMGEGLVRATLDLDVAPRQGLFDLLAPLGVTLRPVLDFRWGTAQATVPLGVYDVDEQSLAYQDGGTIGLRGCPDLAGRVAARRLDAPVQTWGRATSLASLAIRDAVGPDLAGQNVDHSEALAVDAVFDSKREELVAAALTAAGREAYIDRGGVLVIRRPPTVQGAAVAFVHALRGGTLVSATRTRNARGVRNRIIVRPQGQWFAEQWVDDDDPDSPTWVGGPLGVRPRVLMSPLLRNTGQARAAGRALLSKSTGLAASLSLVVAPDWRLEPGDLIDVTLPAVGGDGWATERHLVSTVTLPMPGKGQAATQSITTRSTRPDGGDDVIVEQQQAEQP